MKLCSPLTTPLAHSDISLSTRPLTALLSQCLIRYQATHLLFSQLDSLALPTKSCKIKDGARLGPSGLAIEAEYEVSVTCALAGS
jgi:hypothetical protein